MRLALLAPLTWRTPPEHYGPRERLVSLLCERLLDTGIDVTLFASGDSVTRGALAAVCSTPATVRRDVDPRLWEGVHLANLSARAREFDLIHNQGDVLPLTYRLSLPTPMVSTLYEPPPTPMLPLLSHYGVKSYFVAPSLATRCPELEYTATIYPGIEPTALPYQGAPGAYLVFCGLLHPESGVAEALAIARQADMPLKLVGPVTDRRYFEAHIVPRLDQKRLSYVGAVAPGICHNILAGAYALLQPSRKAKPFSLSTVEAMACGTPVIAWNTGAMAEIVRHDETGFLVSSVDEAADRLLRIKHLDRQRCRAWVTERFHVARMAAEYAAVYEHILRQEKPHAHHARPPWGRWEVLLDEPTYKVKRITVLPTKRLSYQKHFKRQEHWTIVQGQALVTLDGRDISLQAGETIDVPRGVAHRIANPGPENLIFIEVQDGTYFGEDDIIRLQDDYGRAQG
jgi:mannose-6-phosphate isomerase-like protein (cupin superfamily)/glycosyltransferase involved in cell wall biosynthesis